VAGEVADGDGPGSGDVPGGVLGRGPDVDHDDVAGLDASGQLVSVDLFQVVAVAEVGGGQFVEALAMGGRRGS